MRLPGISIKFLLAIYDCIINGYFLSTWKLAKIIGISKTGISSEPENCGLISLLSNLGIPFEIAWAIELVQHCDLSNIISNHQFGFRIKYPIRHALTYLHDIVTAQLNVNNKLAVSFCSGLIYILIEAPFPILELAISFFEDAHFYVSIRNEIFDLKSVTSGVHRFPSDLWPCITISRLTSRSLNSVLTWFSLPMKYHTLLCKYYASLHLSEIISIPCF